VDTYNSERETYLISGYVIKITLICINKQKGGIGIKDIRKMNISMLCKWWWKLENGHGLWQQIINAKYVKGRSICTVAHRQR
jgi:hypothetical protein